MFYARLGMEQAFSFGYWLRRRRKALDLTQEALARQAGCALGTLKKIETDERRPSRQLAERLADCLALPDAERAAFLKAARAELAPDRLPIVTQTLEQSADGSSPSSTGSLNNLPAQPNPMIGREREIAVVVALLLRDARLLTLTGPGGTGKTRLALQVAAELARTSNSAPAAGEGSETPAPPRPSQQARGQASEADFPDGVWLVNLAPIHDPALVLPTIAQTLGVVEIGGQPIEERLKSYLRSKRLLLILDNFEQVVDAAPQIADLLSASPGLKILVTSRATLHIYAEHEFAVPPLALPPVTVERLKGWKVETFSTEMTKYAAVRLFVERARAAKADFVVTAENVSAVAEICRRLDGLPLAIELAAARIKLFAPEVLLARLAEPLAFLTGGPRDLPARQQTLRNTITWSYDLLDEGEQALFRRLGVFVGGCTLEAAEAMTNIGFTISDFGLRAEAQIVENPKTQNALDGLTSLLDKSLLRQEAGPDGEPRFVMLETVREYALERLAASDELALTQRRHAEYFLALAEAAERPLKGQGQGMWLARLASDLDNLRAALDWGTAMQELELVARLSAALDLFWDLRDHLPEGIERLEAALARRDELQPSVRAKALAVTGRLLWRWDEISYGQHARQLSTESLALYRALGDQQGVANVLINLGFGDVC
jgi:predicted ATPase/DNA-binding XRE family transcriptional regulator